MEQGKKGTAKKTVEEVEDEANEVCLRKCNYICVLIIYITSQEQVFEEGRNVCILSIARLLLLYLLSKLYIYIILYYTCLLTSHFIIIATTK
jgi:hypothetical protein